MLTYVRDRGAYQNRSSIRPNDLRLSLFTNQSIPDGLKRRLGIVEGDREQRTIPSCHAVRLLVSVDQVFEDISLVAAFFVLVIEEPGVDLAALRDRSSYVHLSWVSAPLALSTPFTSEQISAITELDSGDSRHNL